MIKSKRYDKKFGFSLMYQRVVGTQTLPKTSLAASCHSVDRVEISSRRLHVSGEIPTFSHFVIVLPFREDNKASRAKV